MKSIRTGVLAAAAAVSLAAVARGTDPASAFTFRASPPAKDFVPQAVVSGVGIMMPVIGRLTGGGGIVYVTTFEVSNWSATSVKVDYQFHGNDVKTGAAISVTGNLVNDGGSEMRSFSDLRFDDFIDTLVQKGSISSAAEADGVLGSMLLIFEGVSSANLASARSRFFSSQFGGTLGEAINGHVFSSSDSTAVAGAFIDSQTAAGDRLESAGSGAALTSVATPQLYSNIFLTNFGQYVSGTGFVPSDDMVTIAAFSSSTGQPIGSPLTVSIPTFTTVSTGLSALGVPAGSGPVIVLAKATSGHGIVLGVGAEVDVKTKDPSGFALNAVPPSSMGPTPVSGGDFGSLFAGTWTGSWMNTTFSTTGPISAVVTVNSAAKTYSAVVTIGGNVFGGSAPPPQTFSGSFSDTTGVTYSGTSSVFGDLSFTISPFGAIQGSAMNVPGPNVSSLTFSGSVTPTTITVSYTATLKAGGTASGTATLTHTH